MRFVCALVATSLLLQLVSSQAFATNIVFSVLVDGLFCQPGPLPGDPNLYGVLPQALSAILDQTRLLYLDATGGNASFSFLLQPVVRPSSGGASAAASMLLAPVLSGFSAGGAGAELPAPTDVLPILTAYPNLRLSTPLLASSMLLLSSTSVVAPSGAVFLMPFSAATWGALFGALAIAAFCSWACERTSPYGFFRTGATPHARHTLSCMTALYGACLAALRKNPAPSRAWSSRMVWVAVFFLTLFANQLYISKLTAIISVQYLSPVITGWLQLQAPGGAQFAVDSSSWVAAYFNDSAALVESDSGPFAAALGPNACARGLCDDVTAAMAPNAVAYSSFSAALGAVRSGAVPALVADSAYTLLSLAGAGCVSDVQITAQGLQTFFTRAVLNASALPGANFAALFNAATIMLQGNGAIAQIVLVSSATSSCPAVFSSTPLVVSQPLDTRSVIAIFWLFLALCAGAWLTLGAEVAVFASRNSGGAGTFFANTLGWYGDLWHRKRALAVRESLASGAASAGDGQGHRSGRGGESSALSHDAFSSSLIDAATGLAASPQGGSASSSGAPTSYSGSSSLNSSATSTVSGAATVGSGTHMPMLFTLASPQPLAVDDDATSSRPHGLLNVITSPSPAAADAAASSVASARRLASPQPSLLTTDVRGLDAFESAYTLSASPRTPTLADLAAARARAEANEANADATDGTGI